MSIEDDGMQKILSDLGLTPPCSCHMGLGWQPVVRAAFEKAIAAGWDKELIQVKQKFCTLRIYWNYNNPEVEKIFEDACLTCACTCEECGVFDEGQRISKRGKALCLNCSTAKDIE